MAGAGRRAASVTSSSGYDSLGELKTYTLEKNVKLLLRNRFIGSSTCDPTCGNEDSDDGGKIKQMANPKSLMESVGVRHEQWEMSGSFLSEDGENALHFLFTISIVPGTTDPRYADLGIEISHECSLRIPNFKGCNLEIDFLFGGTQVLSKVYRLLEDTTCDKNLFRIYCSINKFCLKKDLRSWCSTLKESSRDSNNLDLNIEFIQARLQVVLIVTAPESPLCSSSPSSPSVGSDNDNGPPKDPTFWRTGPTSHLVFPDHVNEADPTPIEFTETFVSLEEIPDEAESADDDESFDESFMCPMGVETMDFYLQFLRHRAEGPEKLECSFYTKPEVNLEIFEFSRLCGIPELMAIAVDNLIVNLLSHTEIEFMLAVWDMGSKNRILKLEVKSLEAIQRKLETLSAEQKESEIRKIQNYSQKRKLQYSSLVNVTRQY